MSQALHHDGGRCSGEEVNTSSMPETTRHLMSTKERILKDNKQLSGRSIMDSTRDGELSMLTKQRRKELLDGITNTDSTSTDCSTSDQDFQCGELLKLTQAMFKSEDTTKEEDDNRHGNSIESPILSSLTTPEATQ
jgi:hypothetical protein